MPFNDEQLAALQADLDPARIKTRRKQNVELRYVEGHDVIDVANDLFGYHAWSYTVTKLDYAAGCWLATVLLRVATPDGETATREDVGVGIPAAARDQDASADAHETAIKASVTDALKRALRTFGNAFGNSLYGKEDEAPGETSASEQPARPTVSRSHDGETRACPTCQKPMLWKEGVSKAGKPYVGWFCSDRGCAQKPMFGDAHAAPTPLRDVSRPEPAADDAASERVVRHAARPESRPCPTCEGNMTLRSGTTRDGRPYTAYFCDAKCGQAPQWLPDAPATPPAGDAAPDAATQLLGDVRGPQLAARLRAALGSQGYDPAEQADWITRQIKASGKSGLPAFTLAEGKALLDRANASAAPAPEGAR